MCGKAAETQTRLRIFVLEFAAPIYDKLQHKVVHFFHQISYFLSCDISSLSNLLHRANT